MYVGNSSGLRLQGESLGFPGMVSPPGRAVRRALVVDVIDFLSLSCDGDTGCSGVWGPGPSTPRTRTCASQRWSTAVGGATQESDADRDTLAVPYWAHEM